MNSYKHRNKNIPQTLVEKWTKQLLEHYEPEDLLEFLIEQTDKNQKSFLFHAMKESLQMEANVKMFEPKTMEEQMKYEAFILEVKPYYNDRQDFLF
jgi:hypothetical protein